MNNGSSLFMIFLIQHNSMKKWLPMCHQHIHPSLYYVFEDEHWFYT